MISRRTIWVLFAAIMGLSLLFVGSAYADGLSTGRQGDIGA